MSDSEYEYEYDDNETEVRSSFPSPQEDLPVFLPTKRRQTFFVNIDITSYNGPIRTPRRKQSAPDITEAQSSPPPQQQAMSPERPLQQQQLPASQTEDSASNDLENRVQIMELHSDNPLISYGNQIFSCEWADTIGTDMHFTRREADHQSLLVDGDEIDSNNGHNNNLEDPSFLKHGTNYSLIAANRIKIIGRKVQLVSADTNQQQHASSTAAADSETQQQQQQQQQTETGSLTGKTAQVRFLQELMDIKRNKGEQDMLLSRKRGRRFDDKVTRWAQTEERLNRIHQLNRDALTGDADACRKLEDLYDLIDRGADDLAPALPASVAPEVNMGDAPSG